MDYEASPAYEWLCGQIVEHAQDAIIFADSRGIIRLWNAGATVTFGYSAAEAVGQSLDLIIPEKLRERHWQGYRRVMATGVTTYGRKLLAVPGRRGDGTPLSLEFSLTLIEDAKGRIVGSAAILRDVTAKWEETKALKQRLAELEKKPPV